MVEVTVSGEQIDVSLHGADAVWSFKRRLSVPVSSVRGVTVSDDLRPWLSIRGNQLGLRLPGTAIPSRFVAGSYWWRGIWTFCCVRRGQRVLVLELDPSAGRYDRIVVGLDDPEPVRAAIDAVMAAA